MALNIKVTKLTNGVVREKYYGKAVATDEVHTKEIARRICDNTTLTEADVYAAVQALVSEMRYLLQAGNTVVLDGFGRFHLTVRSDTVDNPEDYSPSQHIRRVLCKFTPSASRNQLNRCLERPFTDGVDYRLVSHL